MRRSDARRVLLAVLLLAALPARAFDLTELMGELAKRRSGEARFTEERFVSGLDQTLRASGRLSFTAPDRLVRQTELPRPESFVAEGNRLTLERGGRTRQVSLDSMPELAAMIAAIRGTLAGDGGALVQYFQVSVSGSAAQWSMTLVPLDSALVAVVRKLRLDGRLSELRRLEVQLADGDHSVMLIEPIVSNAQRSKAP
jgi:hypothetical protein